MLAIAIIINFIGIIVKTLNFVKTILMFIWMFFFGTVPDVVMQSQIYLIEREREQEGPVEFQICR